MQTRSENTRSQILETAKSLFSQYGYDATGVAEICTAAGVSKGAFYHHFESKQAVFQALLEEWLKDLDEGLNMALAAARTVPEGIVNMAGMAEEAFQATSSQFPLFLEFWVQSIRQTGIWRTTIAPYHFYIERFSDIVREGVKEGSFDPDTDPKLVSQVIVALGMGLLLQAFFDPDTADWAQTAPKGIRLVLDGLTSKKVIESN